MFGKECLESGVNVLAEGSLMAGAVRVPSLDVVVEEGRFVGLPPPHQSLILASLLDTVDLQHMAAPEKLISFLLRPLGNFTKQFLNLLRCE